MPNYSKNDIILVRYPFSDLSTTKIRPAIIIGLEPRSPDMTITPLTSRTINLRSGEFILNDWVAAGLNVQSAVKRGIFTVQSNLILKVVGHLTDRDAKQVNQSLKGWLDL